MHGIKLKQVGQLVHRGQVVDGDDLNIRPSRLDYCAQNKPSDPAEAVDRNRCSHFFLQIGFNEISKSWDYSGLKGAREHLPLVH